LGRWLFLGLAFRSGRPRHFFGGFVGVFFRVFFSGILGVFFVVGLYGFVGVFFNVGKGGGFGVVRAYDVFGVGTVRGFGVVRAYASGASGIGTGVDNPQSTGLSRLSNGLIRSGAGLARRWLCIDLVS
jgi:hypothetical protein